MSVDEQGDECFPFFFPHAGFYRSSSSCLYRDRYAAEKVLFFFLKCEANRKDDVMLVDILFFFFFLFKGKLESNARVLFSWRGAWGWRGL